MPVREDFRRDGLAATFLADASIMQLLVDALPANSLMNIGYPSICSEEEARCKEILEVERDSVELCLVGHARRFDLDIMASLCSDRKLVSANIWLPASRISAHRLLNIAENKVLQIARESITYWKSICSAPLDIALTDCTADEEDLDTRLIDWVLKLKEFGYRSVILCDTKGVGQPERLRKLFAELSDFEWHPHDDNGNGLQLAEIAVEYGATRIGTSLLRCSERCNMLDPRQLRKVDVDELQVEKFLNAFNSKIGRPEALRDVVYEIDTIMTGTHYKLWGRERGTQVLFGVTSDSETTQLLLDENLTQKEIRFLKDELLYRRRQTFLTGEEFRKQCVEYLPRLQKHKVTTVTHQFSEERDERAAML